MINRLTESYMLLMADQSFVATGHELEEEQESKMDLSLIEKVTTDIK